MATDRPQSITFNVTLNADGVPQPLIAPAPYRREVTITCAFGAATILLATSVMGQFGQAGKPTTESRWMPAPGAGQLLWTLEPFEGLWAMSNLNAIVYVTGMVKGVP